MLYIVSVCHSKELIRIGELDLIIEATVVYPMSYKLVHDIDLSKDSLYFVLV